MYSGAGKSMDPSRNRSTGHSTWQLNNGLLIEIPFHMRNAAFTSLGILFTSLVFLIVGSGCNYRPIKGQTEPATSATSSPQTTIQATEDPSVLDSARLLTICMGQEPASLFLYGDSSQAARAIRQSIYDGPLDIRDNQPVAVILENIPSLADGDVSFEPVTIQSGASLVDSAGALASLSEGVSYLPAGCADFSCAQVYSGQQPVQVDQQVVRFRLRSGLTWADGSPLKADDSQYSFEVAKSLYPRARPDLIARTHSYLALDDFTVEWRGLPGYRYSGYIAAFFSPLPRHAWGSTSAQELLTMEQATRKPLGWGAYQIDEWTSGDHITLSRNPNYFRASEGLPFFEHLVFRFMATPQDAIAALLAGECDYLDETIPLQSEGAALLQAQSDGKLIYLQQTSSAWEHLTFGIQSLNQTILPIFQAKEARQALALCLDRQKILQAARSESTGNSLPTQGSQEQDGLGVLDSYVLPNHPAFNPDIKRYAFDPTAANALLDSIGWIDDDANPATPRRSQGVAGIADGSLFEFTFLTTDQPLQQKVAETLRESLVQCGMAVTVSSLPAEQLFSAGVDAPIFGRNFSLTQFGWMGAWQPPCFLFTTPEIPGPYPQFPKGWGGSNPSGYSSLDFDRACQRAVTSMPEQPEYASAHFLAQSIFAEELPVLPLYAHLKQAAHRLDMCGVVLDPSTDSALWNLESFNYGETCPK